MIKYLFILFAISVTVHIYTLIMFLMTKKSKHVVGFVATAIVNIAIAIVFVVIVLKNPSLIRGNIDFFVWVFSGFMALALFLLKVKIFITIYRRTKDENYYRLNYFGKKILKTGIISNKEYMTLMLSMPFFLLSGAYFIAKLVSVYLV